MAFRELERLQEASPTPKKLYEASKMGLKKEKMAMKEQLQHTTPGYHLGQ